MEGERRNKRMVRDRGWGSVVRVFNTVTLSPTTKSFVLENELTNIEIRV